jgi:hypothetical protein
MDINIQNKKLSPFNIANTIKVEFFTKEEGKDLFNQFEVEYNVEIEESLIDEIYEYTAGYFKFL